MDDLPFWAKFVLGLATLLTYVFGVATVVLYTTTLWERSTAQLKRFIGRGVGLSLCSILFMVYTTSQSEVITTLLGIAMVVAGVPLLILFAAKLEFFFPKRNADTPFLWRILTGLVSLTLVSTPFLSVMVVPVACEQLHRYQLRPIVAQLDEYEAL